jgi:hypothetical protein
MLTDAPWALSRDRATGRREFYLGAAGTLFIGWPMLVTAGALAGGWVGGVGIGIGILLAFRRRPVLQAVGAGALTYLVMATALMTVCHLIERG